jgi:hypothetical protein
MIERNPATLIALGALLMGCSESQPPEATAPQTQAAERTGFQQPLTEWGEPDIQGTWPISHLIGTPFERPPQYGDNRLMTDEQFAAVEKTVSDRNTRYDQETASNKMGGGHWAEPTKALRYTSLIVDPPNGRLPPLTEAGKAKAATMGSGWNRKVFDSVADFDSWDRCITRGLPVSMLPRNYNNGIQITQSPGYVVISLEMVHESRVIPTDGRAPLDPAVKQWLGESRGHWEGNTLVIETANFNGETSMTNPGVPGSPTPPTPTTENLRIVERITRIDDDTMDYSITVEDPEVMTRPWTVSYPMERDDTYQMYEYACHEGNTAVRNYIETSRFERAKAGRGR